MAKNIWHQKLTNGKAYLSHGFNHLKNAAIWPKTWRFLKTNSFKIKTTLWPKFQKLWKKKTEKIPWQKWLLLLGGFIFVWVAFIKVLYAVLSKGRGIDWEEIIDSFPYWVAGLFIFFIIRKTPFFSEKRTYFTLLLLSSSLFVIFLWYMLFHSSPEFSIESGFAL